MKAEQRELYVYTKDHFIEELKVISPSCVAPLIATRQVVKMAIESYCKNYCTNGVDVFSQEDFLETSKKIFNEIMSNNL